MTEIDEMYSAAPISRVIAVLGPTNTGKTHLAMQRMMAHRSGVIGFPLRLLARENYDRAVKAKGKKKVALITGEEKIIPKEAQYYICTVEAMLLDRKVDFLAVDEIQMCADPDRGHVFTERLLYARGYFETMFLGAESMRPLITKLISDVEVQTRPRFSSLRYATTKKLTKLPKRTAIVAFSVVGVYELAEFVRYKLGGAAVVMGALSPRTRNAQIDMYQAGDVDYIVATDAIGMGLNMGVDHVAFAATRKFDGRYRRELNVSELGQIAGRAGRHINDGTFGVTWKAKPLSNDLINRIENHRFPNVQRLNWRNPCPDFSSIKELLISLAIPAELTGLIRVDNPSDEQVLAQLLKEGGIKNDTKGYEAVRLLWEVCQIPDFGNILSDGHSRLLAEIYSHLVHPPFVLPNEWIEDKVSCLDCLDGSFENLTHRIASIRTWTYISFRQDWTKNSLYWRERTRAIEDRLSDVLNERLTQTFVDRRTTVLLQRIGDHSNLTSEVQRDGGIIIEGYYVGMIRGLKFFPDAKSNILHEAKALKAITLGAKTIIQKEITKRLQCLYLDKDDKFDLGVTNSVKFVKIFWRGEYVAQLTKGKEILTPKANLICLELLSKNDCDRVKKRLNLWLLDRINQMLGSLNKLRSDQFSGLLKGICFRLVENLGTLPRPIIQREIALLTRSDRKALKLEGVTIGQHSIFIKELLKPEILKFRSILWLLNKEEALILSNVLLDQAPEFVRGRFPSNYLNAIGYRNVGGVAIRVDIMERISALAWKLGGKTPFAINRDLLSLVGCSVEEMTLILNDLGFEEKIHNGAKRFLFSYYRFSKGLNNKLLLDSPHVLDKTAKGDKRHLKRQENFSNKKNSPFLILKNLRLF